MFIYNSLFQDLVLSTKLSLCHSYYCRNTSGSENGAAQSCCTQRAQLKSDPHRLSQSCFDYSFMREPEAATCVFSESLLLLILLLDWSVNREEKQSLGWDFPQHCLSLSNSCPPLSTAFTATLSDRATPGLLSISTCTQQAANNKEERVLQRGVPQ